MCNWQHMHMATSANDNTCKWQHVQLATHANGNTGRTSWTDQLDGPVLFTWRLGQLAYSKIDLSVCILLQLPSPTKALLDKNCKPALFVNFTSIWLSLNPIYKYQIFMIWLCDKLKGNARYNSELIFCWYAIQGYCWEPYHTYYCWWCW